MRKLSLVLAMSLAVVGLVTLGVTAEEESAKKGVAIGETVPDFTLKSIEGKEYKLSDLKGKVVVLDFVSQHCPWSIAHDKSMPALARQYGEKGVVFFGIDSDANTSPEDIRGYVKENGITYTILKDEQNKYADAVRATKTPEIYIIDAEQKLVYHGAYDNRKSPQETGEINYVAQALDAILADKPVETAKTAAWGCTIKRVGA
jgi:peroxiredoxin